MVEMKASDLHISAGSPPMVRHDGEIVILPGRPVLTAEDTEKLLWPIAPERNREEFQRRHDTDFAYEIKGLARFRCNFFMDRKGIGGVFRQIPTKIMTAEEMGLSKEILQLCHLSKGLVLITGPTGSGKSTTLAAMIDYVNRNRTDHIITIEDPLEFVHENKKCLINQRQVGEHTGSFKDALRAALREDPDIVLVGEMRDLETVAIAIETAETGHLVFGTLHTSSAPSTVDRIIDQFPADRQQQIRVMLSDSLKGVISQMLCKKIGGGRVPVLEVLIGTPPVANLIREAKIFQIPSIMQTGKRYGMCLMNESFLDLVKRKIVEPQEAYAKAIDKTEPDQHVQEEQHRYLLGAPGPLGSRDRRRGADQLNAPAPVVLAVDGAQPDAAIVARCASVLKDGALVIFPTDTLYALGGRALDPAAARRVREVKGRPGGQPLPLVASDPEQARELCATWPRAADRLAAAFWPGPLTIVLAAPPECRTRSRRARRPSPSACRASRSPPRCAPRRARSSRLPRTAPAPAARSPARRRSPGWAPRPRSRSTPVRAGRSPPRSST